MTLIPKDTELDIVEVLEQLNEILIFNGKYTPNDEDAYCYNERYYLNDDGNIVLRTYIPLYYLEGTDSNIIKLIKSDTNEVIMTAVNGGENFEELMKKYDKVRFL